MRYLLLLMLIACAAPGTTYQRGTYPTAPPARPGVGAPVVGQPGQVRTPADAPRSPHRRPLPPTREPGVWAGDEPRATAPGATGRVVLLQTVLPLPVIEDGMTAPTTARECVEAFHRLFLTQRNVLDTAWKIPSNPERDCFVAKLYELCARTTRQAFPASDSDPGFDYTQVTREQVQTKRRHVTETHKVALAFKNEKCHPGTETPAVKAGFGPVKQAWNEAFPNGVIDL